MKHTDDESPCPIDLELDDLDLRELQALAREPLTADRMRKQQARRAGIGWLLASAVMLLVLLLMRSWGAR